MMWWRSRCGFTMAAKERSTYGPNEKRVDYGERRQQKRRTGDRIAQLESEVRELTPTRFVATDHVLLLPHRRQVPALYDAAAKAAP